MAVTALDPIGHIRSRYRLVVLPRFAAGLDGLAEFDYVHLLTLLDRIPPDLPQRTGQLRQVPFLLQDRGEAIGVFASRHPVRPNRLGLSLVRVEAVRGRTMEFTGVDLLDRTPVFDIKPWTPWFDVPGWPNPDLAGVRSGWYQRSGVADRRDVRAGRPSLERAGLLETTQED